MGIGLLRLEGQLLGFLRLVWVLTLLICLKHGLIRRSSVLEQLRTDGSLVRDELTGVCCSGSGVFAAASGEGWFRRTWGRLDLLPPHAVLGGECCRLPFHLLGLFSRFKGLNFGGLLWFASCYARASGSG